MKDLLPRLRKKNYSILEKYAFSVSYQGNPVNPAKIDWGRVNIRDYTFTQKPGPHSNLGKIKFLFPNRHTRLHARYVPGPPQSLSRGDARDRIWLRAHGEAGSVRRGASCRR